MNAVAENIQAEMPAPFVFIDSAVAKAADLIAEEGNPAPKLRVFVQGGGCSGFSYGFTFDEIANESDVAPKGLDESTIRMISAKKNEPQWLLEFRLKSYQAWLKMEEPTWANVHYPKIDLQAISYYAAPKQKPNSMDEVDAMIAGVCDLPTRVKCAILPWHTLHAAFNSVASASTEADADPMHAPKGNT